ncbi:MAG: hypothetical protein NTW28_37530 [Candidatus Solibacter sp.]|nr:hypothetical protein [Candidatus Solibacter sp.]
MRVGASVLQAEVAAEASEHLAGTRGVEGDFDWFLVDLAADLESEAFLAGLSGSGLAGQHREQDLEVIVSLAAVVADDHLNRLAEGHLDLAGARNEADALGGGADILILLFGAGGERSSFGGGRIGFDQLRGAARKYRGGEFDSQKSAADVGILGRGELEIQFGGGGASVFDDFGGCHGPAVALRIAELAGRAHLHGDGFNPPVAGIVVRLSLAAGATHPRQLRLGNAHAGAEFQKVAIDAQAGQIAPSHNLGLGERRTREGCKQNNRAGDPNHHEN